MWGELCLLSVTFTVLVVAIVFVISLKIFKERIFSNSFVTDFQRVFFKYINRFFFARYDVWLVDWRTSCRLPSMARNDYTLDDCAAYDYPAAIDKVIEITKQVSASSDVVLLKIGLIDPNAFLGVALVKGRAFKSMFPLLFHHTNNNKRYCFSLQEDVEVVAHCAGSLVLFASLLSGALEGKVRSVVSSQVAANPIPASTFNKLKAGLHIPGVMEALGVKGMTVDTDDHASWIERIFNTFIKGVDRVFLPYEELCNSPVCHR